MSSTLLNILPETRHIPAAERLRTPKTHAIPLLNSDTAKYYSYAHTVQLLSYYYLRSSALVADPLSTMLQDLLPLATAQCLFCAVCLPAVGNWNSGTDAGELIKGSAAKSPKGSSGSSKKKLGAASHKTSGKSSTHIEASRDGGSWPSRVMPTILALILSITIPTAPLMILALILGAPLYPMSLLPHTLVLSLHVSLLGTLPIFYSHGVSGAAWRDVSAAWLPFDEAGVWGGTVGAVMGGWFGAIPIALDWDREWQKWPCTVLWGVILGWSIGRGLTTGLGLGVGRRIDLTVTENIPQAAPVSKAAIEKKTD